MANIPLADIPNVNESSYNMPTVEAPRTAGANSGSARIPRVQTADLAGKFAAPMAPLRGDQDIRANEQAGQEIGAALSHAGKVLSQVSESYADARNAANEARAETLLSESEVQWEGKKQTMDPSQWAAGWSEHAGMTRAKLDQLSDLSPISRDRVGIGFERWHANGMIQNGVEALKIEAAQMAGDMKLRADMALDAGDYGKFEEWTDRQLEVRAIRPDQHATAIYAGKVTFERNEIMRLKETNPRAALAMIEEKRNTNMAGKTFAGFPVQAKYSGARSSVFGGPNDAEDNGLSAFGGKTGRGAKNGVAIPEAILREVVGDRSLWPQTKVAVSTPDGRREVFEVVDLGTSEFVWKDHGKPTLDFTEEAAEKMGGKVIYNSKGKLVSVTGIDDFEFEIIPPQSAEFANFPLTQGAGRQQLRDEIKTAVNRQSADRKEIFNLEIAKGNLPTHDLVISEYDSGMLNAADTANILNTLNGIAQNTPLDPVRAAAEFNELYTLTAGYDPSKDPEGLIENATLNRIAASGLSRTDIGFFTGRLKRQKEGPTSASVQVAEKHKLFDDLNDKGFFGSIRMNRGKVVPASDPDYSSKGQVDPSLMMAANKKMSTLKRELDVFIDSYNGAAVPQKELDAFIATKVSAMGSAVGIDIIKSGAGSYATAWQLAPDADNAKVYDIIAQAGQAPDNAKPETITSIDQIKVEGITLEEAREIAMKARINVPNSKMHAELEKLGQRWHAANSKNFDQYRSNAPRPAAK